MKHDSGQAVGILNTKKKDSVTLECGRLSPSAGRDGNYSYNDKDALRWPTLVSALAQKMKLKILPMIFFSFFLFFYLDQIKQTCDINKRNTS